MCGSHHGNSRGDDSPRGGLAGVDRPGVDVEQGLAASGYRCARAGQAVLVAQQVHQVAGVGRVEHATAPGRSEGLGVGGDQPVGDRVEGAAPQLAGGVAPVADRRPPGPASRRPPAG